MECTNNPASLKLCSPVEQNPQEEIRDFLEQWKNRLSDEQSDLISLLSDRIIGFHIYEGRYEVPETCFQKPCHVYVFRFNRDGIDGEIKIIMK